MQTFDELIASLESKDGQYAIGITADLTGEKPSYFKTWWSTVLLSRDQSKFKFDNIPFGLTVEYEDEVRFDSKEKAELVLKKLMEIGFPSSLKRLPEEYANARNYYVINNAPRKIKFKKNPTWMANEEGGF